MISGVASAPGDISDRVLSQLLWAVTCFPGRLVRFLKKKTDVSQVLTHHRQRVSWMPKLRAGSLVESAWTWADLFSELDVHGQLHLKLLNYTSSRGHGRQAMQDWTGYDNSRIILAASTCMILRFSYIMVLIYICTSLYRKLAWIHDIFWFFHHFESSKWGFGPPPPCQDSSHHTWQSCRKLPRRHKKKSYVKVGTSHWWDKQLR